MTVMNPKVDFYFTESNPWRDELVILRGIVLACQLTEELKWGKPCYTFEHGNVVLIHEFKEYCALLFFKGALLRDPAGVLVQQTRNVQSARQIRFTSKQQIVEMESTIKQYLREAIEAERAGLAVEFKETSAFPMPDEFQTRLDEDPQLKAAFEALTPGRQRGYLLHFSGAKRSSTRDSRVEKCIPLILDGMGLHDR